MPDVTGGLFQDKRRRRYGAALSSVGFSLLPATFPPPLFSGAPTQSLVPRLKRYIQEIAEITAKAIPAEDGRTILEVLLWSKVFALKITC